MRVTIVADDNIVLVDGKARSVDCSPLVKDGIHAVQWHEAVGEEEFRSELDAETKTVTRQPNETITDFAPYEIYVEQWRIENAKQELIETALQRQMDAEKEHAEAKQKELAAREAAWAQLPEAEREKIGIEQQQRLIEAAELDEQRRIEAWDKLSEDARQQLIEAARRITSA